MFLFANMFIGFFNRKCPCKENISDKLYGVSYVLMFTDMN